MPGDDQRWNALRESHDATHMVMVVMRAKYMRKANTEALDGIDDRESLRRIDHRSITRRLAQEKVRVIVRKTGDRVNTKAPRHRHFAPAPSFLR